MVDIPHALCPGEKLSPGESAGQGRFDWAEEAKRFVSLGTTSHVVLPYLDFGCHLAPEGEVP